MKKIFFLFILPVCLSALDYYSDEDPCNFSASIEDLREEVSLSECQKVKLKVLYPENFEIKTIAFDYNESEFLWKKENYLGKKIEEGHQNELIELSFEAMLSGKHYLNLPTIHLVSKEDKKKYVTLHPPLIECHVKDDIDLSCNKLYTKGLLSLDLKKAVEMNAYNTKNLINQTREDLDVAKIKLQDKGYKKIFSIIIIFLVLLFSAYQIYKIFKKKSRLKEMFKIHKDPREQAIEELTFLKKKELPQKGFFETFYVELTLIVRRYIERQYDVKAPEQTTQEFLEEVIGKPIFKNEMKRYLEEFLKFADLVKFARLHPDIQECFNAEDAAKNFIQASYLSES